MSVIRVTDKPANVRQKPLRTGETAWFWEVPSKDRKAGCKLENCALGTDTAKAWQKGAELNKALAAFRQGRDPEFLPASIGTFDWLCEQYRQHHRYKALNPKSREQVEIAMARLGKFPVPGAEPLGKWPLELIDTEVVDIVYDTLRSSGLTRQANYAIDTARTMWKRIGRKQKRLVPALNPFEGLEMGYKKKETTPATWDELLAFVDAAEEMGWPQMAFAALVCWELLQRPENVFNDLLWSHWRPAERPDQVWVEHGKNDASDWAYLEDTDPETGDLTIFYPELDRLARVIADVTRPHGPMMVTRPVVRGNQKPENAKAWGPMPDRFRQKLTREIAKAAGLGPHVTMTAFRHGGVTELADGELPDTLMQALSRHKQRQTLDHYVHRTGVQKLKAARLRLAHRQDRTRK